MQTFRLWLIMPSLCCGSEKQTIVRDMRLTRTFLDIVWKGCWILDIVSGQHSFIVECLSGIALSYRQVSQDRALCHLDTSGTMKKQANEHSY